MENSRIEELLEESIRASARTTHAVRAFVRFALIQVTVSILALLVGGVFAIFAEAIEAGFLVAAIVLVIGGVYGLNVGWDELKKSSDTEETTSVQGVDAISNCKFCGAELHMFSTKCPKCKKRVGF